MPGHSAEGSPGPTQVEPGPSEKGPDGEKPQPREIVASPSEAEEFSAPVGAPDFSVTARAVDRQAHVFSASYEGPLPPPSILKGYEDIVPGAAAKIISWVETEGKHRRKMEIDELEHRHKLEAEEVHHRMKLEDRAMDLGERAMKAGNARANWGMVLAWPLVIAIVGGGCYLIYLGHDTAGAVVVTGTVATVVGAYVLNRLVGPDDGRDKEGNGEGSDG
jgi:uncharacterized membrane protein